MLLLFWESPSPLSAIRVLDVCSSTGVWSTYRGSYPQRKLSVPSSLKATPSCCTLLISILCGNSNWDINVYKFKSNIHKRGKEGDVCVSGSSLPFSAWLFTVLCIHLQTLLLRHHIKYQSLVYNSLYTQVQNLLCPPHKYATKQIYAVLGIELMVSHTLFCI